MSEFYIADMRKGWNGNPYVTFWRPENAGYAYPLPWSGKYSKETVIDGGGYYTQKDGRSLTRFAVPCEVVDAIAESPRPGMIDGDAGPVVFNTADNRRKLRRAAFRNCTN